jgi:hypothetical protein
MAGKFQYSFTREQLADAYQAAGGNKKLAGKMLGLNEMTFSRHLERAYPRGDVPETPRISAVPDPGMPMQDLVEHRKRQFRLKRNHEEALKRVRIDIPGDRALGLLVFGDPHVDDDGTDIETLERHARLVRETDGLYGANVGDTTNNWVGRLARLYGQQETSAATAWRLAEWFIKLCPRTPAEERARTKWLFIVGGNHDAWSGSGDPLNWITRQAGALYAKSQVRVALHFANGEEVRVNCAHDFSGSSMWNPAHGSMRAAQMGFRDHLLLNGHRHTSGYGLIKDPATGLVSHCVQVSSYKVFDEYAKDKGLIDRHISPAVVAVNDPKEPPAGRVTVFFDVDAGVDFLEFKRRRK